MTVTSILRNVSGIGNAVQAIDDVTGRLAGGSFWSQLQPASYRGIAFAVIDAKAGFGRRNAVHEYPFRDTPWVEDIGRQARRFQVQGFLVGDDVIGRRAKLIDACESHGDGELVHPTLGRRKVALIDFETTERWDRGRYFEISFSFVEQGARLFPQEVASTSAATATKSAALNLSAIAAFKAQALDVLKQGTQVAAGLASQVSAWAKTAVQTANDATSLVRLAAGLPGEFGRLLGQLTGITSGQVVPRATGKDLNGMLGLSAQSRLAVKQASDAYVAACAALGASTADDFCASTQALTAAVRAASPTPGDAILSLLRIIKTPVAAGSTGSSLVVLDAGADLLRRAAVAELANAGSEYQAQSSDDMRAARDAVVGAVDDEITIAGNNGEDAVYQRMRALRAQVVQSMNAAGAQLPDVFTVRIPGPIPALVISQRLYGDSSRAEELVSRANPAHPAFMPIIFKALLPVDQ